MKTIPAYTSAPIIAIAWPRCLNCPTSVFLKALHLARHHLYNQLFSPSQQPPCLLFSTTGSPPQLYNQLVSPFLQSARVLNSAPPQPFSQSTHPVSSVPQHQLISS